MKRFIIGLIVLVFNPWSVLNESYERKVEFLHGEIFGKRRRGRNKKR